jgi:hypothetical protein
LREFCQTQRLNAQAARWSLKIDDNDSNSEPAKDHKSRSNHARLVQVHPEVYAAMLQKLQENNPELRHYQHIPHPDGSRVLTPYVNELDALETQSGLYVSKTKQNRLVAFRKNGSTQHGWITHIYSLPEFDGRIVVAVKALRDACTGDVVDVSENFLHTLNDLQLKIVLEGSGYNLVDPGELVAVCAYRHLPAWTFRCHLPLVALRQMPHDLSPLLFPLST